MKKLIALFLERLLDSLVALISSVEGHQVQYHLTDATRSAFLIGWQVPKIEKEKIREFLLADNVVILVPTATTFFRCKLFLFQKVHHILKILSKRFFLHGKTFRAIQYVVIGGNIQLIAIELTSIIIAISLLAKVNLAAATAFQVIYPLVMAYLNWCAEAYGEIVSEDPLHQFYSRNSRRFYITKAVATLVLILSINTVFTIHGGILVTIIVLASLFALYRDSIQQKRLNAKRFYFQVDDANAEYLPDLLSMVKLKKVNGGEIIFLGLSMKGRIAEIEDRLIFDFSACPPDTVRKGLGELGISFLLRAGRMKKHTGGQIYTLMAAISLGKPKS